MPVPVGDRRYGTSRFYWSASYLSSPPRGCRRESRGGRVLAEIIADEHVPFLAACRYKPSGLDKRAQWERTWDLQREVDAAGGRLDPTPAAGRKVSTLNWQASELA